MLQDFRLKVFMAVAHEQNFTKAAESLGISQPAVSQNVAELEKELGVRLFERIKGSTPLTIQGKVFMKYARDILDAAASAESLFSVMKPSVVRVSASEEVYSYYIEPRLSDFFAVHPEIRFERTMFENADVVFTLRPAQGSIFDSDPEVIARIRMSLSSPEKVTGIICAVREETSYHELLCCPSATFSCTQVFRVLKEFLLMPK